MKGIRDRVAVAGVGASRFGEHWERDQYELLVEAAYEAMDDAGVALDDIEAAWVGVNYPFTGPSGTTVADALRLYGRPITRVENYCASGMDAFRNACFAVAAGVYDIVLACGVEKITDQGSTGLPTMGRADPVLERPSAPGLFALAASRSFDAWGWDERDIAEVAVKNHANGVHHPKAHFRREITVEDAMSAPEIASPLRRLDCAAVSDGAAAVVVTRPELARELAQASGNHVVLVKSNQLSVHTGHPHFQPGFDYLGFPATRQAARQAYAEAGIERPAQELDIVECHDCFTITELLNTQDLGLCERGDAARFVRDGHTQVGGTIPVNPSGGLKCFGHPIGATGCRMIYEVTRQVQGRAHGLQVEGARTGLAHNLGGPGAVASVTILGREE
ncbi:MAG TPA: acetyl-CoA acetyltransferase [Solirubrobacterales bacterium]|jgi:acetyl-CoA C-acetyltransferase